MSFEPSFSVCIPNYNYAHYLGRTIESVLEQTYQNFEIVMADNASTDDSVAVAKKYPRVRIIENAFNVGFAPNLDRATFSAQKDFMLLLSSDDLMRPNALERYAQVLSELGDAAHSTVLTSATDVIDPDDGLIGVQYRPENELFYQQVDAETAHHVDWDAQPLQQTPSHQALKETLTHKNSPATFLSTCYPRKLYDAVQGYNSGYRIWPDGHFLNKLLSQPSAQLVYVPQRLFAYRVHNQGQGPQEARSGSLKYQVDAYLHTLEFPEDVLSRIGMTRDDLVKVFIEKAVVERGLQAIAGGNVSRAVKCLAFGVATYPEATLKQPKTYALAGLAALGPLGARAAGKLYDIHRSRKEARQA